MKDFLKSLSASILGCFIVLGLFFLICFVSLAAMMTFSSTEKFTLSENTVLTLQLEGVLYDRVQETNPLLELLGQSGASEIGLDDILSSIKKAKENDKIEGIYINAGMFAASDASLKEIRDELIDFKKSGKFIVSYADVLYTQGCYYLSSVADKMILNPQGNVDIHGYAAVPTFYKGLLDKLGIEMQIFKVGTFKSAVEPFILDKMSDANKEQVSSYIGDMWSTLTKEISESRNISVEQLNQYADEMVMFKKSEETVKLGFTDTLMYETEVKKYIKDLLEVEDVKDINTASVQNMTSVPLSDESSSKDIIAILYAEGGITDGSGTEGITSKRYVKELEKLKDNDKVKAVVFRINSGGGSAHASEQIWKAVGELKEKKPIVVSMGDYAASGGYYIACNASKIIAQPNTLTGSIGIFGMFPNIEGLTKKVGLSHDVVKTNKFADFGTFTRPMRDDEKVVLQQYVENGYDLFITRCADGRGMSKDSIDHIGQGRVWTGNQALTIGLVDAIGSINTAVEEAAKLADIEEYSLRNFPKKTDFLENLLSIKKDEMTAQAMKEYLGSDYQYFKTLKEIKNQDFLQARMPYDMEIK